MQDLQEIWRAIVILHNTNKDIFIWCEENEVNFKSFLQPNNELKNAWEHVVRAKANELGLVGTPDPDYQKKCLEDAMAHEYRAFFDICDWASIIFREKFIEMLKPYDEKTINAVIPDYPEIRAKFDQASAIILGLREGKDIARGADILHRVDTYKTVLENLGKYKLIITLSQSILSLRKQINDEIGAYDPDSIKEIIPNYWTEIRPNLEKYCYQLAQLIKGNGVEAPKEAEYKTLFSNLSADAQKISQCLPAIAEYDKRKKSEQSKTRKGDFWIGIVLGGAITGAFFAFFDHLGDLINYFFPSKK
jgi:hypothetical protein